MCLSEQPVRTTCQSNLVRATCLCNLVGAELCSIGILYSQLGLVIEMDESMSRNLCCILCGPGFGHMNLTHGPIVIYCVVLLLILGTLCCECEVYIEVVEYFGSTITGSRICTLVQHRMPFSTHDALYLTTLKCLLQLATVPKIWNSAGLKMIYRLTRRRERQPLHLSALQPNPSNGCQVTFVIKCDRASLSGTVSVSHNSEVNTHSRQTWPYNRVAWISCWIELLCFRTEYSFCSLLNVFRG